MLTIVTAAERWRSIIATQSTQGIGDRLVQKCPACTILVQSRVIAKFVHGQYGWPYGPLYCIDPSNLPGIKLRTSFAKSAGQFVRKLGHTCRGGVGGGTERHASANGRAELELRFD